MTTRKYDFNPRPRQPDPEPDEPTIVEERVKLTITDEGEPEWRVLPSERQMAYLLQPEEPLYTPPSSLRSSEDVDEYIRMRTGVDRRMRAEMDRIAMQRAAVGKGKTFMWISILIIIIMLIFITAKMMGYV